MTPIRFGQRARMRRMDPVISSQPPSNGVQRTSAEGDVDESRREMKLAIFGAAGPTGRRLVERALAEAVSGAEAVAIGGKPSNPLKSRRPERPGVRGSRKHPPGDARSRRRRALRLHERVGESKENRGLPGAAFYADKEAAEEEIRRSGKEWAIVRPMVLTNGAWTGRYRVGENLKPGRRPFRRRPPRKSAVHRIMSRYETESGSPCSGLRSVARWKKEPGETLS